MKKKTWSGAHVCDFCGKLCETVLYDGRTKYGCWATMCEDCFKKNGTGLGTGNGQKYQLNPETKLYEKIGG